MQIFGNGVTDTRGWEMCRASGVGGCQHGCSRMSSAHFLSQSASGMTVKCFQTCAALFICVLEISMSVSGFLSCVPYLTAPKVLEPILWASGFPLLKRAILSPLFSSYHWNFVILYIL